MKIALGADHRGFARKEELKKHLMRLGHKIIDLGTFSPERADYPDYAFAVARAVAKGRAQRGILICATGIGMSIAANKIPGIRATLCFNPTLAKLSREHNNANVLCLGTDWADTKTIKKIVSIWLNTSFTRGRHSRRIAKISQEEKRISCRADSGSGNRKL